MPCFKNGDIKGVSFETLTKNGKYLQVSMKDNTSNIYVTYSCERFASYKTLLTVILSPIRCWVGTVDAPYLNTDERNQANTLLVHTRPNRYMYLGNQVYAFRTEEPIIAYKSPEGGNKIPFALALNFAEKMYLIFIKITMKT
jgi:hypothetical protein